MCKIAGECDDFRRFFLTLHPKSVYMATKNIKLSELPEEVTEDGLKIYGPASYETQVAILSHYLHALDGKHDIASGEKRYEILNAIHEYIEYKKSKDKSKEWHFFLIFAYLF